MRADEYYNLWNNENEVYNYYSHDSEENYKNRKTEWSESKLHDFKNCC